MIGLGFIFLYLAIVKRLEPLLLLPIGFGAVMANIPQAGLSDTGGILDLIRTHGVENELFPALIFVGVGAMSDFSNLILNPKLLFFSAMSQLSVFTTLYLALSLGFNPFEASSIGIIGAMDGPTAIFVTQRFAPHMLGSVAVCAYTYMALVPLLQIPISKILTSKRERLIKMESSSSDLPRSIRIFFPITVFLVSAFLAPQGTALIGSLTLGNLMRESGVVKRLSDSAQNELSNVVTLLLGLSIGSTMKAESFINLTTMYVFVLGLLAFVSAISFGIISAKIFNLFAKKKVNPLIGACGISAFPMAARTAHQIGRSEDPDNWLLPEALATNLGGQIASVAAGGAILSYVPIILSLLN
jgi:oxaloacetate decarboxylase beta subunit